MKILFMMIAAALLAQAEIAPAREFTELRTGHLVVLENPANNRQTIVYRRTP